MKNTLLFIIALLLVATGFSQLDSTTIPIRLSYFEAGTNSSSTILRWKTVCYLEYANFDIQQSTDGNRYESIYNFTADRLRCQDPFEFTPVNPNSLSGRIFYRINVGDIDGKAFQSKIIAVFTNEKGFVINSFVPTLVTTAATVSISTAKNQTIMLSIVDMSGTIVKQQSLSVSKGAGTYSFSFDRLQTGRYQAIFQPAGGEKNVVSFIKQ